MAGEAPLPGLDASEGGGSSPGPAAVCRGAAPGAAGAGAFSGGRAWRPRH